MKKTKSITWQRIPIANLDPKGWNVAVVGGTGGLGRAISQRLASRGAKVNMLATGTARGMEASYARLERLSGWKTAS